MATGFQSSFIPKGAASEGVFQKKKAGALGVLSVSLLVVAIVAAGGLYVYRGIIKNDIQNIKTELADSEKSLDNNSINEMLSFSKKISLAEELVQQHKVVSSFLNTLASSTVSLVRFSSFDYNFENDGNLSVKLKGEATSYAAIASQEKVFLEEKNFKSVTFSGLSLTSKGFVTFDLALVVSPDAAVYSP